MTIGYFNRSRSWLNAFLFQPVDACGAAWFRIAFAVVLPYFFWSRGASGPYPAPALVTWLYENIILTFGYWMAVVALCVPLALGWRPRLFGCLLVLILAPLVLPSRGPVSRQVLLFALLAFSCLRSDAVRLPWRATNQSGLISAGPSWPVRLIQLQLTLLYGANAVAKSSPSYFRGDVLMDLSIARASFKVDLSHGAFEMGPLAIPVALAAAGSVLTEYFLATAFWFGRWKWIAAIVGVGFHGAITFILTIHNLHLASIFLYLAFLLPVISRRTREEPA